MDIYFYIFGSVLIIMLWHFAFNTSPKNFGLMQMIGAFIAGGAVGYYLNSYEAGLLLALGFALIFI